MNDSHSSYMGGFLLMNKKDRIVTAAIEVFIEKGIEKTKISDIVKLAGIAQGTFYLYFPSKLSVMPAIAEVMMERMIQTVKERVQKNSPFIEKLSQMIDAIFDFIEEYHEIQAIMYAGLASTEHIKEWETVYQPIYMWVNELLSEAKSSGVICDSIDAERSSRLIIALIESAAEQIYLYDQNKDDQAMLQKEEVLNFISNAIICK